MIPQDPGDISPEWLTEQLQGVAPGVTVEGVEVVGVRDATNHNATIRLRHDAASLPATMFLKIPPVDPVRRSRLDWASMGERETRFYRHLAPSVDMRVPHVYVAELDDSTGEFLLLLEDVAEGGCALPDPVQGLSPELVGRALSEFAALHARFEPSARRAADAPWLAPTGRTSDYGARLLREGIASGAALRPAFVEMAEAYIADRDRLQDAWEVGPTTVLHGDAHIGNVFVDADARLGFFDWGLMTVGSPLRDVSYFLVMTLDSATRASVERDLLADYLAARRRAGAAEISFAEAWRWYRVQSGYAVVASCQAIVVPDDASPGRRAFAEAFVDRASSAVEDLDPLGALAELV